MGKQICPDEPMFQSAAGSGRGAGDALVDLNLEGGENRVDIDLFGDPEGEHSSRSRYQRTFRRRAFRQAGPCDDHRRYRRGCICTRRSDNLDFTLGFAPERGADESPTQESPTREMPKRDEPTVESELMEFGDANFFDTPAAPDAPTTESPALRGEGYHDRFSSKLPPKTDQTAEVAIDDLGLDLDDLEQTGSAEEGVPHLEEDADHPADAPTMVAGLDERSRRMMEDAQKDSRDRDLTELERELEASFISDLDSSHDEIKTAQLGPESAPTVLMPREIDQSPTSRFKSLEISDMDATGLDHAGLTDLDSTSRLHGLSGDSVDLDLDRLATALGGNDTLEQPAQEEDLFSNEVFESTQRNKRVDLDVGESLLDSDAPTNNVQAQTNKLMPVDLDAADLEPVTMSEVGTKLDLARAYMDMGDPEGARSILEEVVQEGSASQKQEASRLIESLPG